MDKILLNFVPFLCSSLSLSLISMIYFFVVSLELSLGYRLYLQYSVCVCESVSNVEKRSNAIRFIVSSVRVRISMRVVKWIELF